MPGLIEPSDVSLFDMNLILFRYEFSSDGARLFHIDQDGNKIDPDSTLVVRDTSTRDAPEAEVKSGSALWWFDRVIISESGLMLSSAQLEELRPNTDETASSSGVGKNAVGINVGMDGQIKSEFAPYFLVSKQDTTTTPKTATEIWFSDHDFASMPSQDIRDLVAQRLRESAEEHQRAE